MPLARRWHFTWLPLLIGMIACLPGEEGPPHVIIVSAETLNRDALPSFEKEARPLRFLDAFAEQSVRFLNAYSTASWTLPAHASLLTGLYPDRHGANKESQALGMGVTTVAEALRSRGYETVAFTGGGFLNARYGFSRGFDRYDEHVASAAAATAIHLPIEGGPQTDEGKDLFARAIAFVSQRSAESGPLFLFLHTYSIHHYYKQREWALAGLEDSVVVEDPPYLACLRGSRPCSPEDWGRLEALYRAELEFFDVGFGRLVEALERANFLNRSVIFFLSDHGEGFDFEQRRTNHGGRLHEDQIRIPLIVRVADQAPRDESARVSLVDLMPTILELTGTPPVARLDGRSFAAALRGEPLPAGTRPLYSMEHQYIWTNEGVRIPARGPARRPRAISVINGPYWYIRGLSTEELYDMRTDRSQRRNLAPESGELDIYRRLVARRSSPEAAPRPIELDAELADQLRSLGYTD